MMETHLTQEADAPFVELCKRCRGKGLRWFGRGTAPVPCGTCKGLGERTFKVTAEKRADTNAKAKARKQRKLAVAIADFRAANPAIWEWMETADMEFAGAMRDALLKWGALTEKQFCAAQRCSQRYRKKCLL